MMKKKGKDRIFLTVHFLITAVGLVILILRENAVLIFLYLLCMSFMPLNYFNYSIRRWGNRRHAALHEKKPCDGEPSAYNLVRSKISLWFFHILGLILPLLPTLPM